MAILSALCLFLPTHDGFTNPLLRERIAALLGTSYTASQMTYDLRRRRLKALIQRLPGKHRYVLTLTGRRIALFLTKLRLRLLRPGLQAADPGSAFTAPPPVRLAFDQLDAALDAMLDAARLAA